MYRGPFNKTRNFFKKDLWQLHYDRNRPVKSIFLEWLRVTIAACKGFSTDNCYLKASALTFYSLLSIVPVLAVGFGIAKGFGFEKKLEEQIAVQFQEQPVIAKYLITFSYTLLQEAQGGLIAGIGVITLFYTVIKLLDNVEASLNDIWKVFTPRPFSRKFSDYFSMMLIFPFFFAVSSSVAVFITTRVLNITQHSEYLSIFTPVFTFILQLIPYLLSWALFTFLYVFMPNTTIPWRCGIVAGIIAGTTYQLLQLLYIKFQLAVSSYGAIYGSFAALPLFLVWINFSWLIMLMGAEFAYHAEVDKLNRDTPMEEDRIRVLSTRKIIGLYLVHLAVQRFCQGTSPLQLDEISKFLGVSPKILEEIAEDLKSKGILSKIDLETNEHAYQPGRDVQSIHILQICEALDSSNKPVLDVFSIPELNKIEEALNKLEKQARESGDNISVKDLVF